MSKSLTERNSLRFRIQLPQRKLRKLLSRAALLSISLTLASSVVVQHIPIHKTFADESANQETVTTQTNELPRASYLEIPKYKLVKHSFSPNTVILRTKIATNTHLTFSTTVKELLEEFNIPFDENDKINVSLASPVTNEMWISVVDVREEIEIVEETIPYTSQRSPDPNYEQGITVTVRAGENGLYQTKITKTYEDDTLVSTVESEKTTVKEPVTELIAIGTKQVPKQAIVDGITITYCQKQRVWATSYDKNCTGCSGRGITSLGYQLTKGVIAVDPRTIPYYTKMYVPGYGHGTALDTGGGLRGWHIDLGFDDFKNWGGAWSARYTDVYFMCK